jgi:rod shape-determining protein MreD
MKVVVWMAAIVLSVTVQTTSALFFDLTFVNMDIPLVVVVLAASSGGPIVGLWAGTFAGLLQDLMSGGLVGVSGLSKSLIGVVTGLLAGRLMRTGYGYRTLLITLATIMNVVVVGGVYRLIALTMPVVEGVNLLQQAILNVAAGILIVVASERMPVLWRSIRKQRMVLRIQRWRTN